MVLWRWLLHHINGAADIFLCTYRNLQPGTMAVSPLASSLPKSSLLSFPELQLIIWWTKFKNFISITEEFQPQSSITEKFQNTVVEFKMWWFSRCFEQWQNHWNVCIMSTGDRLAWENMEYLWCVKWKITVINLWPLGHMLIHPDLICWADAWSVCFIILFSSFGHLSCYVLVPYGIQLVLYRVFHDFRA